MCNVYRPLHQYPKLPLCVGHTAETVRSFVSCPLRSPTRFIDKKACLHIRLPKFLTVRSTKTKNRYIGVRLGDEPRNAFERPCLRGGSTLLAPSYMPCTWSYRMALSHLGDSVTHPLKRFSRTTFSRTIVGGWGAHYHRTLRRRENVVNILP